MRKAYFLNSYLILVILLVSVGMFSCSSTKHIKYFEDLSDSVSTTNLGLTVYTEPVIQVDDIVTIIIQTVDPSSTLTVNSGNVPSAPLGTVLGSPVAPTPVSVSGYLVSKDGNVDIPTIGKLKLQGLTTSQAKELVLKKAGEFYKDPMVIVRFANFKISVTGEVARPAVYVVPNEKINVLDALALAGDLTIYGKRENVLLIRDGGNGEKYAYRLNLNKSSLVRSPYFYLKQNDILYVEPTKGKAAANDIAQTRNVAIISSILSLLVIVISRI